MKKINIIFFITVIFSLSTHIVVSQLRGKSNRKIFVKNLKNNEKWRYKRNQNDNGIILYSKKTGMVLSGKQYDSFEDIPQLYNPKIYPMKCMFMNSKKIFYFLVADVGKQQMQSKN